MIVSRTLLSYDINRIMTYGSYDNSELTYKATLHNKDSDLKITFLKFVEIKRDYNNSIGDDIRVCFILSPTEYLNFVMYNKDYLEMTLEKNYGSYSSYFTRYKCFIVSDTADKNKQILNAVDSNTLDTVQPIELEVQLLDLTLYALTGITIEGTYNNENLTNVLYSEYSKSKYCISKYDADIKLNITKLDNINTYGNVLLPSGTKLLSLPTWFQDSDMYGLYNGGVGTYFQKYKNEDNIFIYPLFDPKLYNKTSYKIQIYQDKTTRTGFDRTFLQDGDILKIIPRFDMGILDMGESGVKSFGDTIVIGNTDNNSKSFKESINNELINDAKKNIEVIGIKNNRDGVNSIQYVGNTNNAYKYRAQVLRNTMAVYNFHWDNSDIDLIYPGMPCSVIYENENNKIITLQGTVQGTGELWLSEHKRSVGTLTVAVMSETIYKNMNDKYESNL